MTNLYFKNNKVLPKHKINDMNSNIIKRSWVA